MQTKNVIYLFVAMFIIVTIIGISAHTDNVRTKFWNTQMELCGRAGYIYEKQSNECTPVDYLKNK